jgi:hypothetical protein
MQAEERLHEAHGDKEDEEIQAENQGIPAKLFLFGWHKTPNLADGAKMPGVLSQDYIIRKGAKPETPPRRSF